MLKPGKSGISCACACDRASLHGRVGETPGASASGTDSCEGLFRARRSMDGLLGFSIQRYGAAAARRTFAVHSHRMAAARENRMFQARLGKRKGRPLGVSCAAARGEANECLTETGRWRRMGGDNRLTVALAGSLGRCEPCTYQKGQRW